jgi:hypothetical protein
MPDLPIACTLTPAELEHGKASLLPGLVTRAVESDPAVASVVHA